MTSKQPEQSVKSYHSKLFVPQASSRPDTTPDFSHIAIPPPTDSHKPEVLTGALDMQDLAYGIVRVLGDDHLCAGPWVPEISADTLRLGLKHMLHVRAFDDRMFKMQRQGKLSFYMKSTGEEAISVAQGMALRTTDMMFPSYRQQGLLFVREHSIVDLMCQCLSNAKDNIKGRQMPIFYSSKQHNFFSLSGNLATQYSQAVGWGMAAAYKGEDRIAVSWVGDGTTAAADVYHALVFGSTYKAPVILNVVNNQWAISTPQSFASTGTTFAARGIGLNVPGIRVDGNDFLAVYAVTQWAAERARQGGGPTFIEHFTYRTEGHSTSDNPDAYRGKNEAKYWPLGDPINRLKQHLIALGEWSEAQHLALTEELSQSITAHWQEALAFGSLDNGPHWPVSSMFEDVFEEIPPHLLAQSQKIGD
ncbi:MAG: 2-oxoisovalerate dehydrogenase subunit alpha [Osedax symbiont Rs1]|nr:MAG: 2-oxoisovalerate dehydrogenase subunit alpha [Osedax symbiont Rs1]